MQILHTYKSKIPSLQLTRISYPGVAIVIPNVQLNCMNIATLQYYMRSDACTGNNRKELEDMRRDDDDNSRVSVA